MISKNTKNLNFSIFSKNRPSTTLDITGFQKSDFSIFRKYIAEQKTFFDLKKIRKFLLERKVESKFSKKQKFIFERKLQNYFSKIGKYFIEEKVQSEISKIGKCSFDIQTPLKIKNDTLQPYSIKGLKMEFLKFCQGRVKNKKISCSR